MATAEEILAGMTAEETQQVLVIDNDLRRITIPEGVRLLGVTSDDDVLRLRFTMPRVYGEVDLSGFAIRINYLNAGNEGDVYSVDDAQTDGDVIRFSWLVGRHACKYKGDVRFIVCLKRSEGGEVVQEYNTTLATLPVLEGLETGEAVAQAHPDVIEAILTRLDTLEQEGGGVSTEAIAAAVEAYIQEHGVTVEEVDPTVPDWAKQPSKPTYTASEVGARPDTWTPSASDVGARPDTWTPSASDVGARPDTWTPSAADVGADAAGTASGAVAAHNASGAAHADLRALIEGLNSRLNALADSDDTTLDQLSEIVAYIKSNKSLIDAVATGKVSVSDIVDNLTTNASGKVLSAAQGVALKAMIDGIVIPTALPNPQPITINGQRYDGSEAVTVTVSSEGGGTPIEIDGTLTQSGKAADAKAVGDQLSALNEAIDAKGDPTDEQVATAVNAYLTENPVSGLSDTASALLITILRSGVYTDDQSDNITALETALGSGTTEPEEPDVPVETTYAISNELINCTSSNSATSVKENAAYSATLTANDGYTLTGGTVTVTMGGTDITDTAYADGVITIAAVTGNVEIMASAVILETEATLPEDGLLSFFDLRNLGDNMNVTIDTTKGVYATQGAGSLFSWAGTPITSSDEYGAVLPRVLIFSTDRTANQVDLGSEYTVMMSSYGASAQPVLNDFMSNVVTQPSVRWEPKYNTSDSTTKATAKTFSLNTDGSGYRFMAVVVSGSAIRLYFDGELIVENDGSVYDGFASWVSKPTNFGTIYNAGQSVAYAAYNKALSTEEIVNAYSFFETLEVTA